MSDDADRDLFVGLTNGISRADQKVSISGLLATVRNLPRLPKMLRVCRAPLIPLCRTDADGTKIPALCWRVGDDVLVHPDRWSMFWRILGVETAPPDFVEIPSGAIARLERIS